MLPIVACSFVARSEGGYVFIAFGREGGASVDDVDPGIGVRGCEAHIDGGDNDVGDEIGVDEMAGFKIEQSVNPDGGDGAVVDGKDCALFVVSGLGKRNRGSQSLPAQGRSPSGPKSGAASA